MESDPPVPVDQFIILIDNRQDSRVIRIRDNKQFKWRKTPIPFKTISQHPYYTLFEVGNNKITPIEWVCEEPDCPFEPEEQQQPNNNREIFTIDNAQKLQTEDIERKKQQLRPEQLIGELIENNQQFSKRTEYSKEKYIKKKQRKYLFHFHAEPVSLSNIHQHYFKTDLRSIYSVRWDIFALMLLYGGPYKRVLVGDQGRGLLIGAVIERGATFVTAATGKPLALKQFPIVEQLNISKQKQQSIKILEWRQLKQQTQTFDNFLLLGNYDFVEIIQLVNPLLKKGAPIAFICQSLSLLEAGARQLKKLGFLNVKLFDSWAREYQVLKNRTHPLMSMDSCSGFLLTGIKMEPF